MNIAVYLQISQGCVDKPGGFCESVLWTNETKVELSDLNRMLCVIFGNDVTLQYYFNEMYIHTIMIWAFFATAGPGAWSYILTC